MKITIKSLEEYDHSRIQIQGYEYLGMDYTVRINGKQIPLCDLSDKQINELIIINDKDKTRTYRDEMIYIFNDVKKIRRRLKLEKIENL